MTDVRAALQWGSWAFGGLTLLVFYRSPALGAATGYGHPELQRAAYYTAVAAWALTALVLPQRDPRLRWPDGWHQPAVSLLVTVILGAAAVATLTLPATAQPVDTSWAVATVGWVLLALSAGRGPAVVVLRLGAPLAVAMAVAATGGPTTVVLMTARTLGILGLQLPVALAAQVLDRTAQAVTALWLEQAAIRTDLEVAGTLHDDRLRRSQAVAAVVEPVLVGLAEPGTGEDPDEAVRRRCDVAAAQVRRLLAEWHRAGSGGPDPLGDDLTACLDEVQAAGLRVDVAVPGGPAPAQLPAPLRRVACDVVRGLAGGPVTRLRVSLLTTPTEVCLGVVAHAVPGGPALARGVPQTVPAPLTLRTTTAGDSFWVELTCPL